MCAQYVNSFFILAFILIVGAYKGSLGNSHFCPTDNGRPVGSRNVTDTPRSSLAAGDYRFSAFLSDADLQLLGSNLLSKLVIF